MRAKKDFLGSIAEIQIDNDAYEFIVQKTKDYCGINLGNNKQAMVQSRLSKNIKRLHLTSYEDYLSLITRDHHEFKEMINSLTTNKTEFFREADHFQYLTNLVEKKIKANPRQTLYFWSAASSTGEEVYSLMITLEELKLTFSNFSYKILGTDIDTQVLMEAENAIYNQSAIAMMNPKYLHKYFVPAPSKGEKKVRIKECFLDNIKFRQHNLIDLTQSVPLGFDFIFLRNVLIYFDKQTIGIVMQKMLAQLKHNGTLFIGHSETLNGVEHRLRPLKSSIYMRE